MTIDDVVVTTKKLVRAKPAEVRKLESQLWISFPSGYSEYVTKLGEGVLGGELVRIYPPWKIEKELEGWRQRIKKYWFWDAGRALLPKERPFECVLIGDTTVGDELVFHPTRADRLFVLPRNSGGIYNAGSDLWSAVEWMCNSGKLARRFRERNFTPFDSRKEAADSDAETSEVVDPQGESLDDLLELAKQWAKRHAARKSARRDLKEYMLPGSATQVNETEATLLFEALVMEGEYPPFEPSYTVVYRVDHKPSGLELGQFIWHQTDVSNGYQFNSNDENLAKIRAK